jgi:hypothetical protein
MRAWFLFPLILVSSPVPGQDRPALRVVIEGAGQEAAECGIKSLALQGAAARALKAHGIQISADPKQPYLYINVNAYRVMQGSTVVGCTTRLGVSVRGNPDAEPQLGGFRPKAGSYVVLCEAGRLLSGSQRDVAGNVAKAFEADIRSCLAQLSY